MSPDLIIYATSSALIVGAVVAAFVFKPKPAPFEHTIDVRCDRCDAVNTHAPTEDEKADGCISFMCGRCGKVCES
jgi:hypothetical protein